MSIEQQDIDGFELTFSVQVGQGRMLELFVDELDSGDCFWQVSNPSGQVVERSDVYEDQAYCLQAGLNKNLK